MRLGSKSSMMLVGVLLAFAVSACDKKDAEEVSKSTVVVSAKAKKTYAERCAVCHGDKGAGDGPGAASLRPKPRIYSDAEWQKSVTDEDLRKAIIGGGMAVGKSPIMPANSDLKDDKEVVDGLVQIIRNFGS